MSKLKKKEKILTIGFGVLMAVFIVERLMLAPFIEKMESLSIKIDAEEDKVRRLLYMESQKENISKTFEKVKPYIVTGETDSGTFSDIMNNIEAIAKEQGIILLKMKPEVYEDKHNRDYNVRKVTLSIEGYLKEVVPFLYKLENSNYPLSINKLDLKVKSRETNLMTVDLDVHMIYF
ncbi:MAG: hypothetical protein KAI70_03200 [Candidatus Omnitrophica bacterium]|nr:hypothetical protein [Candidatus Omnitrophota bacterium]